LPLRRAVCAVLAELPKKSRMWRFTPDFIAGWSVRAAPMSQPNLASTERRSPTVSFRQQTLVRVAIAAATATNTTSVDVSPELRARFIHTNSLACSLAHVLDSTHSVRYPRIRIRNRRPSHMAAHNASPSGRRSEQRHEQTMANPYGAIGAGEPNGQDQIPGAFVDAPQQNIGSRPSPQQTQAEEAYGMAESLSPIGIANVRPKKPVP